MTLAVGSAFGSCNACSHSWIVTYLNAILGVVQISLRRLYCHKAAVYILPSTSNTTGYDEVSVSKSTM